MTLDATDLDLVTSSLLDTTAVAGTGTLRKATSTVWLGSGLAKISAFYGASLLCKHTEKLSRAMTAIEYCQTLRLRSLPLLITLRGTNQDATGIAESIIRRQSEHALLLTGDKNSPAAMMLRGSSVQVDVADASLPERDRRFVNCKSVITLSSLAYRLVRQSIGDSYPSLEIQERALVDTFLRTNEKSVDISSQITAVENWRAKSIIFLSDGMPSELSVTWASILAESGIIQPICADIKDYTHGDHLATSLCGSAIFIVLRHQDISEICDIFIERFASLFTVVTINLESAGAALFWENLFYACNIAGQLSHALGYHGLRPPKHPIVWSWRGWGNISTANYGKNTYGQD